MNDGLAVVSRGSQTIWSTLLMVLVYYLAMCDDWGEMNRVCVLLDWV